MRRRRERAAPRQVRRLAYPAPERQSGAIEKLHELRDRVRAVLRMKQRVGEPGAGREVGRVAQQRRERMIRRKRLEARGEVANFGIRCDRCRDAGNNPAACRFPRGRTVRRPSRAARRSARARRAALAGPRRDRARWCSTPVQTTCSKVCPSSAARSTASWRTSRLSSAYLRFSSCVNAMLFALTSIPMTRARGQRTA